MAITNTFNYSGPVNGDRTILTGVSGRAWRLRQLNIQNIDSSDTNVVLKSGSDIIFGPIKIKSDQLLSLELSSTEDMPLLTLNDGASLIINSSESVDLTIFGFGGCF